MGSGILHRIGTMAFSATLLLSGFVATAAPATAQTYQSHSNENIWTVRRHLEGDIRQLQHDDRDYGGLRVQAITSLQMARNELLAAERYIHHESRPLAMGVNPDRPYDRNQGASNRNARRVRRSVDRIIGELDRDAADYGGHREAAILDLKTARTDLTQAERYAAAHGY